MSRIIREARLTPNKDKAYSEILEKRLQPYYDILDFHVEGAMLYFRARKR